MQVLMQLCPQNAEVWRNVLAPYLLPPAEAAKATFQRCVLPELHAHWWFKYCGCTFTKEQTRQLHRTWLSVDSRGPFRVILSLNYSVVRRPWYKFWQSSYGQRITRITLESESGTQTCDFNTKRRYRPEHQSDFGNYRPEHRLEQLSYRMTARLTLL